MAGWPGNTCPIFFLVSVLGLFFFFFFFFFANSPGDGLGCVLAGGSGLGVVLVSAGGCLLVRGVSAGDSVLRLLFFFGHELLLFSGHELLLLFSS